jgi:NAD(P)-dependent dehydrogenase (short-subunit alcohol dehydrogenase family)
MTFRNRTVLVTGAAGQLGHAVSQAFARQGANLVLLGRTQAALATVFGAESETRLFVAADLLDQTQVNEAVAQGVARFGRIDVLCNMAGGFTMGEPVHQTSVATWDTMYDLNVRTVLNMARAVVPGMQDGAGGKIINVAATAALRGASDMGAYCAAKSGVVRLTESMAAELREQGINVNCVLPSILDTPANRLAMPTADPHRWVALDDLAQVVLFLASPAAMAVHGVALPVTGLS